MSEPFLGHSICLSVQACEIHVSSLASLQQFNSSFIRCCHLCTKWQGKKVTYKRSVLSQGAGGCAVIPRGDLGALRAVHSQRCPCHGLELKQKAWSHRKCKAPGFPLQRSNQNTRRKKRSPPQKRVTAVMKPSCPALSPAGVSVAAMNLDSSLVPLLSGRKTRAPSQTPPHESFPREILSPAQAERAGLSASPASRMLGVPGHAWLRWRRPSKRRGRLGFGLSSGSLKGSVFSWLTPKLAGSSVLQIRRARRVLWATYLGNRRGDIYFVGFLVWKKKSKVIFRF